MLGQVKTSVESAEQVAGAGIVNEAGRLLNQRLALGDGRRDQCEAEPGEQSSQRHAHPALRQAQMGIAVFTATDVAKSAAGIVLTEAGLGGIVASVKQGRIIFQRILTYILKSVTHKFVGALFLLAGILMTGHAVLTPLLLVISMITGDFLSMLATTDNVHASPAPNVWHVGGITAGGIFLGFCDLAFCTGVLAIGKYALGFGIETLQTLSIVTLIFGGQATLYVVRERRHL